MPKELKTTSPGCLHNKKTKQNKKSVNPCLGKVGEETLRDYNMISKGFSENMCLLRRASFDHERISELEIPKS